MPYGSFNGLMTVALPFLLRRHDVAVEEIAAMAAMVQVPAVWYVLWAPIVDFKLRRRTWVVLLSLAAGTCAAIALNLGAARSVRPITVLLVAGSVFAQPISSAIGGLVSGTMPDAVRGRTGGWSQAGILAGGVLTGGLAVWLSGRWSASSSAMGIVIGALVALPGFAALWVPEKKRPTTTFRQHLVLMGREVAGMFRRRDVWLGAAFFLSPIASGALMNLFSGIAIDFHASSSEVIWAIAIGGVMTVLGALAGGFACDRFDRMYVYAVTGLFAAASAGVMMFAPLRPVTYVVGAALYAFVTGFGYAAFMALAFHLLGEHTEASGTRFTLFMAAVNVPLVYMIRLDGIGHSRWGVRGMLGVDAIANLAFGLVFLGVLVAAGRSPRYSY
jgi:PAT family beta-lactamase induction signal transducer AmpG